MDNVDNHLVHVNIRDICFYVKNELDGKVPDDFGDTLVSPFENAIFLLEPPDSSNVKMYAMVRMFDLDYQRKNFAGAFSNKTGKPFPIEVKWLMHFSIFVGGLDEQYRLLTSKIRILRDTRDIGYYDKLGIDTGPNANMNYENSLDVLTRLLHYCLTAYRHAATLMHCKNIELKDEPLTRQQRRRKERKNEIIYKVLAIKKGSKSTRYLDHGHSGDKHAYHLCRGHFKTYTDDAPLFGRLTGTYWWPAHVRGSKEFGEVVKDYQVG